MQDRKRSVDGADGPDGGRESKRRRDGEREGERFVDVGVVRVWSS